MPIRHVLRYYLVGGSSLGLSFYAIDRFERGPAIPAGNDAFSDLCAQSTTKPDSAVKLNLQTKCYATKVTNHPKDAHVLAAAIHVEADYIVTFNLKDFVTESTEVIYIKAIHPDDFATQLMNENRMDFLGSIGHVMGRLARPTPTLHEYLGLLTKCGLPKTANAAYTALTNL